MKNKYTPFDMNRKPARQYPFLMPLLWIGSYLLTRKFKLKIKKEKMKGLKPPFLVIAAHQGFSDYYIGPLSMFPRRAMYVSDMEGFAAFGLWLYRGLGCIGKRRYVPEINVLRHIKYAISKNQSVFVYPESRHSNVGTTSYIPKNIGRLCKFANVPVVVLTQHGSYLANPFWDEEHTRKVPIEATMTCICTKEELQNTSADIIQKRIEELLNYDEYKYQKDNNIKITYKNRAAGLHKALYQCVKCKTKYEMSSYKSFIVCNSCKTKFEMTELGDLCQITNISETDSQSKTIRIPDWYEWERTEATNNIENRTYNVYIEKLYNENGFTPRLPGILTLNSREFVLETEGKQLHFPHFNRESVQTEYDYKKKGMCIVLSTSDCCYYIYSDDKDFNPTELQFIGEYYYQILNK